MKTLSVLALLLAASVPACANDTSAQLSTGGLEFITNEDIVMESEELFISSEQIRVVYQFHNTGTVDQDILVAFPMPDIVPNWWSPVAFPSGPDDNLFGFETTFNGEPVEATLHEYAYAFGVDRTKVLRQLGLPIVPFTEAASQATDALDDETIAELLHMGMVWPDEFDEGNGWEKRYWPGWTYRSTYTWEGTFPAGETVEVIHSYRPSVGGTVAVSFLGEPYEDYDPAAEYRAKYCTDDAFRAAVAATQTSPEDTYSAPFTEEWISYILTTGGNWGGGAIKNFRLVVDKGSEDNFVSFCGEDVRKIGPTTFEMVKTEFWPDKDLDILILQRREGE